MKLTMWRVLGPLILGMYLMGLWMTNIDLTRKQPSQPEAAPPWGKIMTQREATATGETQPVVIQSSYPDYPREPRPRPALDSIRQGWNITGDPSWLLNLAIIGFPKTGTSTLMKYLHMSPQVHVFDEERCEMGWNQQRRLIESLYIEMPPGDFIRGIKCPRDLEIPQALKNYQTYFNKATDYMVGLRHPIEWFESFYNFRVNNMFPMPPADTLIGRCTRRHQGVCTFRGNFHLFLANLGKTNIVSDPNEQVLIPEEYRNKVKPIPLRGRIFLWEMSQLRQDEDHQQQYSGAYAYSNSQFREDLRHFLRLEQPLPEMIWVKPGYSHSKNQTLKEHVASKKIDICDSQYQQLRQILLQQGTLAARWIRDYFLESQDVYVSQKDHFVNVILKSWERDPCLDRPTQEAS